MDQLQARTARVDVDEPVKVMQVLVQPGAQRASWPELTFFCLQCAKCALPNMHICLSHACTQISYSSLISALKCVWWCGDESIDSFGIWARPKKRKGPAEEVGWGWFQGDRAARVEKKEKRRHFFAAALLQLMGAVGVKFEDVSRCQAERFAIFT